MVKIGLPCGPEVVCKGIGWAVAVIVICLLCLLIRQIWREVRQQKTKKR